jgi:hypothetical protein
MKKAQKKQSQMRGDSEMPNQYSSKLSWSSKQEKPEKLP